MKFLKFLSVDTNFINQDLKIEKHNFKLQSRKKIVTKLEEDNERMVHNDVLEIIKIIQAFEMEKHFREDKKI